jgi:hypothetical protein
VNHFPIIHKALLSVIYGSSKTHVLEVSQYEEIDFKALRDISG